MAKLFLKDVTIWRGSSGPAGDSWSLDIGNLDLKGGGIYSVLGENMVGKSTLLRILGGREAFRISEDVKVEDHKAPISKAVGPNLKLSLDFSKSQACLLSHDDPMLPELSIWNNVRLAGEARKKEEFAQARNTLVEIMKSTPILASMSQSEILGRLSSGGKAIVKLARACCWSASVIMVDEVTAHLDPENARLFFRILGRFMVEDTVLILVSHAARDHDLAKMLALELEIPYHSIVIERRSDGSCFIGR